MPHSDAPPDSPLVGLRVADFSRVLAGPFCTRILSDLGAEVVKIEPPDGDLSRRLGPRRGGMSGYYMQQNCGKLNVSIDLKSERGRELARSLVVASDVLVENYRPGVMAGLGLGPAEMLEANPRLVYCSISGFGHVGPWRDRRAFAGIAHATTGMLHRQAWASGQEPTDSVLAIGDTVAGLQATVAILAALRLRERTGCGQIVDLAMHDSLLAVQEAANFYLFGEGGRETDYLSSWVYRCGNDYLAIPSDPRAHWQELTAVMERPELLTDERYDTYAKRAGCLEELEGYVQEWVATHENGDGVVADLERAGLPGARILSLSEALDCEQTRARGMTPQVDDRSGRSVRVLNSPYRFSAASAGVRGLPAFRGEDNRDVLERVLGLDSDAIDALEADGVISARLPERSER